MIRIDGHLLHTPVTLPQMMGHMIEISAIDFEPDGRPEIVLNTFRGMNAKSPVKGWVFSWDGEKLNLMSPTIERRGHEYSALNNASYLDYNGDGQIDIVSLLQVDGERKELIFELSNGMFSQTAQLDFSSLYVRYSGEPKMQANRFKVLNDTLEYTVSVLNRDGSKKDEVTSAAIIINGTELFSPKDFKRKNRLMSKTVSLNLENTLEVKLNGKPGSSIRVSVGALPDDSAP